MAAVVDNLTKLSNEFNIPTFAGELVDMLRQCRAVIAGGFILGSITNRLSKSSDIDIYVGIERHRPLLDLLIKYGRINEINVATPYDTSFFSRNGIFTRFSFSIIKNTIWDGPSTFDEICDENCNSFDIDLMVLKEDREVVDCVSNFDFTFCQVWFDGEKVNGTHMEDTLAFKGSLNPEYLSTFLSNNKYTIARYTKYLLRGYQIDLNIPAGYKLTFKENELISPDRIIIHIGGHHPTNFSGNIIPIIKPTSVNAIISMIIN